MVIYIDYNLNVIHDYGTVVKVQYPIIDRKLKGKIVTISDFWSRVIVTITISVFYSTSPIKHKYDSNRLYKKPTRLQILHSKQSERCSLATCAGPSIPAKGFRQK